MSMKTAFAAVPVLALCLAGAAAAQSVSQEAWVGPAIPTVGGQLSRAAVIAERQRADRQSAATPEQWVGNRMDASITVGALRRTEVLADMFLYARAGLLNDLAYQQYQLPAAEVGRRVATYERLRHGAAFAQEVDLIDARMPRLARSRASLGSGG